MPLNIRLASRALARPILLAACASALADEGKAPDSGLHYELGLGVTARPAYEGSDEDKIRALPLIGVSLRNEYGRFALGAQGLAWTFINRREWDMGIAFGYDKGRKESASADLAGLGDVNGASKLGLFGMLRQGPLNLRLAADTALNHGNAGNTVLNLNLGLNLPLSEQLMLTPSLGTSWASAGYMHDYFGVDSAQAARSGLSQYQADAGFKDVSLGLNAGYRLDQNWHMLASYRAQRLLGDAADSPITRRQNSQSLMLGLGYRW